MSKAYALINRFSEDIDITIFRDDLGHTQTQEELDNLSNKKRKAALNAINDDCHAYITGPLLEEVSLLILEDTDGKGRIEVDPSGETGYVQAAVKIESGAKSALDPNAPRIITPYISDDVSNLNLSIPNVTTIDAERTFWDKVVILHGLCSELLSNLVFEISGSCSDLIVLCGFNTVFEFNASDNFGQIIKAS